ncbi:MAG: exopolysaccharide biosynthesis polyprenyl glycosylphosphotransferase [Pseudohongiellaceae bacterium]
MQARSTSILVFIASELIVLLAVLLPVIHMRAVVEAAWGLGTVAWAPDEPLFILARSLLMALVIQAIFGLRDLYRWSVIVRPQQVLVRLVESIISVLIVLPLLYYGLGLLDDQLHLGNTFLRLQISPFIIVAGAGAAFLVGYGLRTRWPRWIRTAGLAERVAFVGSGHMVDLVFEELRVRADPGIDLVGFFDDSPRDGEERNILGGLGDIEAACTEYELQRLVIDPGTRLNSAALLRLRLADLRITDASSFYERLTGRISPASLSDDELFLERVSTSLLFLPAQRVVDVAIATIGLILFVPIGLLVALAVKIESRGPIFYSQERMGSNGKGFPLVKFRSMRADAETASGPVWAAQNDTRITRVGRWLRKLRIDEVPQLWAVLRNDMSMVGPRPERPFFVHELERQVPHYARRHLIKPGVTGWAQINYSYGNTTDDAFIKLQFDLYYIKHRSLALDIAIILRTFKVVVLQQGAV